jgi:hypothetical protein
MIGYVAVPALSLVAVIPLTSSSPSASAEAASRSAAWSASWSTPRSATLLERLAGVAAVHHYRDLPGPTQRGLAISVRGFLGGGAISSPARLPPACRLSTSYSTASMMAS